jgi:tRNA-specific 2-thiouridylase
MTKKIKAVSLISGGLDSMLSSKLMLEQGIHVEGVNFFTGFCVEGHTQAIRNKDKDKQKRNNALWVAEQLGIKLHIIDVIEEYKDVLLNPKHGYGKNMNPCLDCKGFMVKKAHQWMIENDFDFIITGEVIGQRPMSQRRETMPIIQKESGAEDLLLRPLSGKNLPATIPETKGWIKRDDLLDITGRTRKVQMELAKKYGFDDYATPAGGCCFLTDKQYSDKLVDMWQARGDKKYELDDLIMLKVGRHIRPTQNGKQQSFKMIIARDEGEVKFLENYRNQYKSLYPISHNGPLALIEGEIDDGGFKLAARILARYTQGKNEAEVEIGTDNLIVKKNIKIEPLKIEDIKPDWFV